MNIRSLAALAAILRVATDPAHVPDNGRQWTKLEEHRLLSELRAQTPDETSFQQALKLLELLADPTPQRLAR